MDSKDKKIRLNKDIVSRSIGGNYYLVDSNNRILHSLNETGSLIFEYLKKNKDIEQIKAALMSEFETYECEVQKDLHEFLQILKSKKIITSDDKEHK
ncbi:PqqD family protein [Elusimicrobiota bacterium]